MNNILEFFNNWINKIPNNLTDFQSIILGILLLALIALWCIIDIIGYFASLYLVKYVDIETKYPKYKWIVNYFLKANYIFIILQLVYIILIYIFIIGISITMILKS